MDAETASSSLGSNGEQAAPRWLRWLRAMSPPRTPLVACFEPVEPILVPCRGRVYDFQVFPYFTWRSAELGEERMRLWVRHFSPHADLQLRREAAAVASQYAPQDGQPFAEDLNRRLEIAWRFRRDGVDLTCKVWCRVELDEAIRTALQPLWQERIEMEERWKLDLRRAEVARDVTEAWSGIIEKLYEDPFSEPAAALGDEKFAKAFVSWREEHRKELESLLKLLEEAGRGVKRMGVYESAEIFDATLNALRKRHGLLVDDSGPDSTAP